MKKINSNKTPIYRDSGFYLSTTENTLKTFKSEAEHPHEPENYIYSRYRNPTVVAAEQSISKIEGSKWALLAQSGMAAIDIALSIFQEENDKRPWMFFTEIYGGTNSYIDLVLKKRRGINVERFAPNGDSYDINEFIAAIEQTKPKLIYFEAISNPMLIVADVKAIISEAKKRNIVVIVDNTFATPYLWKPINDGADLVIHSATKYLSGHGNISAGVICGNQIGLMKSAIEYRKWVGHMISPDDAYRLNSQVQTFELRYKQQMESAFKLAQFLENSMNIEKVIYPGLAAHPTHEIARDLFEGKGYGAIITFQLAGATDDAKRSNSEKFITTISEHFDLIPTLGDTETIFMPIDAVWGDKYPFPGTLRLSIGIESYEHINEVIADALNKIIN
ncbi:MAG: aminotransferase class V-fold PLP-dependent enzyme [Bacteroidales bacterium]|nr:aminotransferase class V-fold PLP-dependent enzyme [Bacteroidales bacterium]